MVMKNILVTEDDPGLQDIYRIILEKAGYKVTILSNGMDILNNHYEKPDLFLLDKQLSGVDGIELCRHLKSSHTTQDIPVILISASVGIDKLAMAAGANDFIEKPFDKKHLLDVIAENINGK
jgi:CheY-like chemotaxis protein